MDGISRSRGWDKEIPHCVLPMEQLVLSDKWARKIESIIGVQWGQKNPHKFSYTTTVRYSTVYYLLVTLLRSMFTVNDVRCKNQLEQRINSALNNGQMVISSKWINKN